MAYTPREVVGNTLEELRLFLDDELRVIATGLGAVNGIQLDVLHVEPSKPRDGQVVLADGTNWNPGSGVGFYGYRNGSWTFLG